VLRNPSLSTSTAGGGPPSHDRLTSSLGANIARLLSALQAQTRHTSYELDVCPVKACCYCCARYGSPRPWISEGAGGDDGRLTPITLSWLCMERLLLAAGQDAQLASKAGEFIIYLIPGLWGYAGKMAFQNYLHAQVRTFMTLHWS